MNRLSWTRAILCSCLAACAHPPGPSDTAQLTAAAYPLEEQSIAALQADLTAQRITSEQLVALYIARIRALDMDEHGPALHSVLALNPRASDEARARDAERAAGKLRGPLHGIPVLLKDNIESADPLPTTAGSEALAENMTGRDAPIVAKLRAAGAIVLGKSNMSEWANIRSPHATSGWSALGGLTKNPYALDRSPCGSSSGSGVAVAANLVPVALGTETDGSITCPASVLGLVGLKPTVGLVSRTRIIPISLQQDTAGPLARSVLDAALLLSVIAGSDSEDPATAAAAEHQSDYVAKLSSMSLAGRHFGILKCHTGFLPQVDKLFTAAVSELRASGAEIVDVESCDGLAQINEHEQTLLITEFRARLNAYLATTPPSVKVRTLADVIAWNREHAQSELRYFQQESFEQAEKTAGHDTEAHAQLLAANRKAAADMLDQMLASRGLDALIAPTVGPAWTSDLINGDHVLGGATTLPAVAGYPHLSMPMGQVDGLPVGLSFIGPPWSEAALLSFAYAYEQRTHFRRTPALPASTQPDGNR